MAVRDGGWWPVLPRKSRLAGILSSRPREPLLYLIDGPAGIGKSELARSLAGADALFVTAIAERSTTPLGVLDDLVREWGGDAPDLAAAVKALGARASSRIVVVDDAPRLDLASAEVIRRVILGYGATVVATARSEEPLPDPLDSLPAMREELANGFSVDEAARLLEACFRVPARTEDVQRLVWATGGNPLHLRIEVETAVAEGRVLHRGAEVEVVEGTSTSLTEAVVGRIAGLPDEEAALLAIITRVQPVPRAALAESDEALSGLVRRGLVAEEGGRARVSHPLVAEAVAERGLEPDLEETLRVLRATGGSAQRFAALRLEREAGVHSPLEELLWAGSYASLRGDPAQAALLAEEAASRPASRSAAFATHLAAATYRSAAGDLDLADDWFARATALAAASNERAALAGALGAHLAFRRGDAAAAVAQGEVARAGLSAAEAVALDAELWRWRTLASEGGRLEIPDAIAATVAAAMRGEPATADRAVALLADQPALGEHAPTAAIALGIHRLVELRARGDAAAAVAFLESSRAQAGDEVGFFTLMLASHRAREGRLGDATDLADLAIDQLARTDPGELLPLALALRATLSAERGNLDDARTRLDRLAGVAVSGAAVLQLAECRAHLLAADGRPDAAADEIMAVVGEAVNSGYRFFGALTLSVALRFGETARALDLARSLLQGLADPIEPIEALLALTEALEARRLADVPGAASRLARAGLVTAALDGASLALEMPAPEPVRRRIRSTIVALSSEVDAPAARRTTESVLTPREWQVARAAADRLRSREIAERLGVSTRTVDNQLYSVYRKLGVSSRDELREALDAAELTRA